MDNVWDALYRSVLGQRSAKTGLSCLDAMPSRLRLWSLVHPTDPLRRAYVSLFVEANTSGRVRYLVTPADNPIVNVLFPGS